MSDPAQPDPAPPPPAFSGPAGIALIGAGIGLFEALRQTGGLTSAL